MNRTPKKLAVLLALAVAASACSSSVEPDRLGLEYDAGAFSDTKFDHCVKSGTREYYGPGDKVYNYPGGQRTFEFADKDTADGKPISVSTKDQLEMQVSGVATFSLNPDCKVLQQFHERIGLKYGADTDEGWAKLLRTYLGQPLERAMDQVSKEYEWEKLYSDPKAKKEWEDKIGKLVVEQVNALAGGQFFCSSSFTGSGECGSMSLTIQQPVPPENVRNALAAAQQAIQDNETQENRNRQIDTELKAIKELEKVLGPYGAILYQGMKSGQVKILPVPTGGDLNVTTE